MATDVEKLKNYAAQLVKSYFKPCAVVVGADDNATLLSLKEALEMGILGTVLVGDREKIEREAEELTLDMSSCSIVDVSTVEKAIEVSLEMLRREEGQVLVKGSVKTGDLLRKYLEKERGLRTGRALSHLGLFNAPGLDKMMVITDGGLNLAPDLERKKDIIANAAEVLEYLGVTNPRVAVLAHVEKASNLELPMVRDAVELERLSEEGMLGEVVVDGPLSFDIAVNPESARKKGIGGPVAGNADILLAHDIGMGNVIYKVVQTWLQSTIAGMIVGGRVPVVAPSRADTPASKLAAVSLGVICAIRSSEFGG